MKKGCTVIIASLLLITLVACGIGYKYYKQNFYSNVDKEQYVLIPKNADFKMILDSVKGKVVDIESFKKVAENKKLDRYSSHGRYQFKKGMNNTQLVNMIKAGNQTEDSFRIIDFGNVYQMIGRVTKKTEIDSAQFVKSLNEIAISKGLKNAEDLKIFFFIDTYNFFWTVSPEEFFNKFEKQYNKFWNDDRVNKERNLELTRNQIYALASIVYKESGGNPDEMKTIAGLYLNRYRKGMKLQSDPTVIYSINKDSNFSTPIKRVLYKHLGHSSPYNTYKNAGIPPGPICVTDKNSVDAVLNAEKHDYIFMAADPKIPGYHRFTSDDRQHAENAREYQKWLNEKGIR